MFHGGGGSVPAPVPHTSHRCPGGLAPRAFPHRTPRLFQSEARVAEVSGQPVPPGSLLTLGAPRDADGHTDGWMDGQTDRHAAKSGCALAAKHVTWHAAPPEGSTGGHPPLRHLRAGGGRLARRGSPGHPARRHRGDKRRAAPPPQLCYFSQPEFAAAPATAAFQRPRRSPPRPAHRAAGAEQLARRRPAAAATSAARRSRGPARPRPPRASRRTCRQPGAGWERCSGQLCGAGAAGEPGRSGRRRALPRAERALGAEGRAASGGRSEDGGSAAARPSRPDTPTGLGSGGATAAV